MARKRSVNKLWAFCLTGYLLALLSCTSENATKEAAEASVPIIPSDDQLIEIGIQKLAEWSQYWKEKGADLKNLKAVQEHDYELLEWPGENVLAQESPLKSYQFPHPTSEGVVDIYGYKLVFTEGEEVDFNPDSEVIFYRSNGMRERLLFMGPSGAFEDAVWVTDDHLLVSGHVQKENGFVPVMWLIKPDDHKYTFYESNFSTQEYSQYDYLKVKLDSLIFPGR